MRKVIGWDIGGAHVKAALLDVHGDLLQVQQVACPLWQGLDQLDDAICSILKDFSVASEQVNHALTMTGELVDLFANREEGVLKIAQYVAQRLVGGVQFYSIHPQTSEVQFVTLAQVPQCAQTIASANWHASAVLVAQTMPSALLIDIGSTTTDIIPFEQGRLLNQAFTDAARMQQDTLVYTGVVRTPVMALAQKLMLDGVQTNVAAEYFATMADVYRLTGELTAAIDMANTADGEAKTALASARRLARMVGHDVEDKPMAVWQTFAQACREKQCEQIWLAIQKHIKDGMTMIGAGAGHFLVETIAQKQHYPYTTLRSLLALEQPDVAVCLPAYAVAKLAHTKAVV